MHLTISVSDNEFVVTDAANVIRQYAAEGYNLVIAHGSQYGGTVEQLAPQFPKVSFAWGTAGVDVRPERTSSPTRPNSNEGGYVAGLHGAMSARARCSASSARSTSVTPSCTSTASRPERWPQDPKATVHTSFTGSFSDDSLMADRGQGLRRREGGRADRQLAVGRRRDRRRQGGQRRLVRHAVEPGDAGAEEVVVVPGLQLDRRPEADLHGDPRPACSAVRPTRSRSATAARRSCSTRLTRCPPSVKAEAEKLITEITDGYHHRPPTS